MRRKINSSTNSSGIVTRLQANNYRIFHINVYSMRFKQNLFVHSFVILADGFFFFSLFTMSIYLYRDTSGTVVDVAAVAVVAAIAAASSPLICYSFLSPVHRLKSFWKRLQISWFKCSHLWVCVPYVCVLNTQIRKKIFATLFSRIFIPQSHLIDLFECDLFIQNGVVSLLCLFFNLILIAILMVAPREKLSSTSFVDREW